MKKIVYVDMHIVLVNFQSGIDQLNKDQLVEYEGRLDEVPNIFWNDAAHGKCYRIIQ